MGFLSEPALLAAAGALAVLLMLRRRGAARAFLGSAAAGAASLGLVSVTGFLTGVALPFNLFTLLVCLGLGAPGVIGLLVMKLFWP